jgi:hypothetical protein
MFGPQEDNIVTGPQTIAAAAILATAGIGTAGPAWADPPTMNGTYRAGVRAGRTQHRSAQIH